MVEIEIKANVSQVINTLGRVRAGEFMHGLADKYANVGKQNLSKPTQFWKKKPGFYQRSDVSGLSFTIKVGTDDQIYAYLNDGTRKHTYSARNFPYMKFQIGYFASTKENSLDGLPNYSYGPFVRARQVTHPGVKARKFSDVATKLVQDYVNRNIGPEVSAALRGF